MDRTNIGLKISTSLWIFYFSSLTLLLAYYSLLFNFFPSGSCKIIIVLFIILRAPDPKIERDKKPGAQENNLLYPRPIGKKRRKQESLVGRGHAYINFLHHCWPVSLQFILVPTVDCLSYVSRSLADTQIKEEKILSAR